jgi:Uma2 family endonuclease
MNTRRATPILAGEGLRIPARYKDFDEFRKWTHSRGFPERGRIDYLAGRVEADLSPEEIYAHGVVKAAIAVELHALIVKPGLGNVFIDRARIVSVRARLSVEPDVVVVLWSTLKSGGIRDIASPRKRSASGARSATTPGAERIIELEGAPDLVVEIVSDSSVTKDRKRLPPLYAQAGVPELWLVDARGAELLFEILRLGPAGYVTQPADAEGWVRSPLLGRPCRLIRRPTEMSRWGYELQHAPAPETKTAPNAETGTA